MWPHGRYFNRRPLTRHDAYDPAEFTAAFAWLRRLLLADGYPLAAHR